MKYLLVPAAGSNVDDAVFATAMLVAQIFGSHVEFFHAHQDSSRVAAAMTVSDIGGAIGVESIGADLERDATAREHQARIATEAFWIRHGLAATDQPGEGMSVAWAHGIGTAADLLAQRGRTADLVVLGRQFDFADAVPDILLDAGRPVLVAPATPPTSLLHRVVIAWSDSAEAARAVTAAMPFLERAASVCVISIDAEDSEPDSSADRLAHALRWHNRAVEVSHLPAGGKSAAEALLAASVAQHASLLVMGGFSHSRLREMVFGGFTRSVLEAATLPVLIAH